MNPPPVAELQQRRPESRPQNVKLGIADEAIDAFDYYQGYTFLNGRKASQLELWGFLWWTVDRVSGPSTGGFSRGFSSGFEGGIDSPQGAGFDEGFSSGFGH